MLLSRLGQIKPFHTVKSRTVTPQTLPAANTLEQWLAKAHATQSDNASQPPTNGLNLTA
jgi:hypothetical protein